MRMSTNYYNFFVNGKVQRPWPLQLLYATAYPGFQRGGGGGGGGCSPLMALYENWWVGRGGGGEDWG